MAATCAGHLCSETRYRANNKDGKVTRRKGAKCPTDPGKIADFDAAAIKTVTEALDKQAADAAESDDCPAGCECKKPDWPKDWDLLEKAVVYKADVPDLDCTATVEITYDWECQDRSGKCHKPAPTKAGLTGQ